MLRFYRLKTDQKRNAMGIFAVLTLKKLKS